MAATATNYGTTSPLANNAMASSIYANAVGNAVGSLGNGIFGGVAGTGKWGNAIGMVGTNLTSNLASSIGQSVGQSVIKNGAAGLGKGAFKAGLKGGLSNFTKAGNLAGLGMAVADTFMKEKTEYAGEKGDITKGMDAAYDAISAGVNFIPGIGQGISLAMQANKLLGKGINNLGGGTDGMTTVDAILGSAFLQTTPLGMINGFGGSRTDKGVFLDQESRQKMATVADAYTDTAVENAAANKYGKKYGLLSKGAFKEAQKQIRNANMQRANKLDIANQAKTADIRAGMVDANNLRYQMAINGGYKPLAIGKEGLKITPERMAEAKRIAKCIKKKKYPIFNIIPAEAREAMRDVTKVPNDALPFFKEGGNIELFQNGGDVNVIPEGALHARKHNMENAEHITKKGIPVVDLEGKQQAEIERNEIIFRKEVTDKLEKLAKDGSDEAAIEAGKILAHEIIENTEDRTGLIEETIGTPEQQTVENHQVIPEAKGGTKIKKNNNGNVIDLTKVQKPASVLPEYKLPTNEEISAKMKSVTDKINEQNTNKFLSNKEANFQGWVNFIDSVGKSTSYGFDVAKAERERINKEKELREKKFNEERRQDAENAALVNNAKIKNLSIKSETTYNPKTGLYEVTSAKPEPIPTPKPELDNTTDKEFKALFEEYMKKNQLASMNGSNQSQDSGFKEMFDLATQLFKAKKESKETPTVQKEESKETPAAQKGSKLPEFKTFEELVEYLNKTGRGSDEDYDLKAAYNDPEVYQFWRKEEEENPGKGHWLDKYKKESHMTYSNESILGDNPKQNGGYWIDADGKEIFMVSPYLESKHSVQDYLDYFNKNEPNASFRYKGVTYSTGRKKK